MLFKVGDKLEEWLLPRGRILLVGLLAANVLLTVSLVVSEGPQVTTASTVRLPPPAPIENEIKLLAEAPVVEPVSQVPSRECRIWGPEKSADAFADLQMQLEANGSFPELQTREIKAAPDYLVYIGELGSRDNAKRVARELKALSIDNYLVNPPEGAPIVSVGVFSRQKLAEKQQDRMSALGYDVFIEELERAQTVYQLTAHVPNDSPHYKSSTSACMAFAHNP